jgi:hypothetical protein
MSEIDAAQLPALKQDADAYLAACSDLLLSMASNLTLEPQSLDVLLDAMPMPDLRQGLRYALGQAGVLPGGAVMELL